MALAVSVAGRAGVSSAAAAAAPTAAVLDVPTPLPRPPPSGWAAASSVFMAASGPPATAQTGRKRALLIGCNYAGTAQALGGCVNDAHCLAYLLRSRFGFREQDICMLTDASPVPELWPTRQNIFYRMAVRACRWAGEGWWWWLVVVATAKALSFCNPLTIPARTCFPPPPLSPHPTVVNDLQPGDSLFFSFSGHGTQVADPSGDEDDGLNEAILPCDHEVAGYITDDELNAGLINPLPPHTRLFAVLDACHSASLLDMEWIAKARPDGAFWKQEYRHAPSVWKGTAGGFAVAVSAARDRQTAADTSALSTDGAHTGAATYAFIAAIEAVGTAISHGALLASMKATLDSVNPGAAPPVGAAGGMLGRLLQGLMDAAGASGQTPALTSNLAFDLNAPLCI